MNKDEIRIKISQFNQEGNVSILINLLSADEFSVDLSTDRGDLKYRKQNILNEIYYIIKKHVLEKGN